MTSLTPAVSNRMPHLNSPFGLLAVAFTVALGLLGCDGSSVTGPSPSDGVAPVSVSFTTGSGSPMKTAKAQRTFTDSSGNTLRLDQVELVLREVEFDRADDAETCSSEDGSESEEGCEELESGPLLVPLPLDGSAPTVVIDTTLPVGTWEGVEFDVHKLDPNLPSDSTLLTENDFPPHVSIQAQGSYTPAGGSAQSFTFTSDLSAEREIEFEPPVEVTADGTTNITFSVQLTTWFRQPDSTLVDPRQADDDGPFEERVESNIESSIEGFEDDDRDGEEDGDDENGDDDGEDDGDDDGESDDDDDGDDDGDDDDDDGDDDGDEDENEESEVERALNNTGPDPDAAGEAEYEKEPDQTEFKVEVEDLDAGAYEVVVADTTRGELEVEEGDDSTEGEIEFKNPSESGHPLLDFDPRGKHVSVAQSGTVYLEVDFPSSGEE